MKTPPPSLVRYIEREIIPRYASFDRAHGIDHVRAVIERSLALAARHDADPDMVYAVAAYHDAGLARGRELHHRYSAEVLANDSRLTEWFTQQQIATMRDAVEDHRASSGAPPRTLYGCIVAEADRCIDPETILRRTVQYSLDHHPELDREGHYTRCVEHLNAKYAEGGYLRLWLPGSEHVRQLVELRAMIRNPEQLRSRFDAIYDRENSPTPPPADR